MQLSQQVTLNPRPPERRAREQRTSQPENHPTSALSRLGRALRHRNYRLFFVGQGLSLIGTWLTRFAIGYETYALSHSAFQLGLVAFFGQAPTALITPFAGVLVDRWDRRKTLLITQIAALLQSSALTLFALTGRMTVWHLLVLGMVQAVINGFDMPARQTFVRYMVDDRRDLPNAIALNSTLVNAGRLIGPVAAAVLVDLFGVGGCFLVDAISYVAVVASLLAMRVEVPAPTPRSGHILFDILEGLRYVRRLPLVCALLLLLISTSTFGGAYASMLPALSGDDARALGWLMGAAGAGAFAGGLYLAARGSTRGLVSVIATCSMLVGISLCAIELTHVAWWFAIPVLFVVGGTLMVQWTATNTLVQSSVDDAMLGRVMSLYAVTFFAGIPVGSLIVGAIATVVPPVHTFALSGLVCIVSSLAFRRALPHLPKPASAVSEATTLETAP